MLVKSKQIHWALILGGVLLLSGCTRSVSDVADNGTTAIPVFPNPDCAVKREGSFVNLDNLQQVRKGNTKAQIYEMLGTPHFSEGVLKVKEWNYIFHFTKADKSVLTCQYKVLFDSKMTAQSFYFLPENCLSQLDVKPARPSVVRQHQELSGEGLFAFGSAMLLPGGVAQIQALSANLQTQPLAGKRVTVVGHTDRFGPAASNQRLSLARANSVKQQMVVNGIPASMIDTRGLGANEPRVYCPGSKTPAVIECLAPNRRITVDVESVKGE
ncbi:MULTISPECIES: OmpA family protein [Buttiauxella]|uniref:OmpA family protein n=1 Tax=Buttiauxella TaxID=82976 RepID=UPI0010E2A39E|nr:OmpA family protein [Buttiauxella sp. BIGb0552]TDX14546.1 OmpA family protein [Buttiauxella sp. BIGb0552]